MISAVIPYRPDAGRTESFEFVREYLSPHVGEVIVADDGGDPFSRGCSINDGVQRASGDTLLICDADLVVPVDQIDLAVILVSTRGGMALPFDRYHYLSGSATLKVMAGVPVSTRLETQFVMNDSVGGVCVIDRKTFNQAGGFDPSLRGWGGEDYAFWAAVDTLAQVHRVPGPLYHLWHPTDPVRPKENMEVMARYMAARGDRDAMLDLIGDRSC
jgi:hypothetical protein